MLFSCDLEHLNLHSSDSEELLNGPTYQHQQSGATYRKPTESAKLYR